MNNTTLKVLYHYKRMSETRDIELFVVTSVINPTLAPLSYTTTRSVFTEQERFSQTMETIASIKQKLPKAKIAFLECSNISPEFEHELKKQVDFYVNYYSNKKILEAVTSPYKGIGECYALRKFLEVYPLDNIKRLYKISGRYRLNDNFNYTNYDNNENNFKRISCGFATTLYKIEYPYFFDYIQALEKSVPLMRQGYGVEMVLGGFMPHVKEIELLGIEGLVGVDRTFYQS